MPPPSQASTDPGLNRSFRCPRVGRGKPPGDVPEDVALSNFRSCYDTTVTFQPTLTLLVGENNSGKSNVIEALRLATAPLNLRRHALLRDRRPLARAGGQGGRTRPRACRPDRHPAGAVLHRAGPRYRPCALQGTVPPGRDDPEALAAVFHAGKDAGPDPEPEKREQIRHVYLAPLRDAQRELDSASGSRLAFIIEQLTESRRAREVPGRSERKPWRAGQHDV